MPGDKYELENLKVVTIGKLLTKYIDYVNANVQANEVLSDELEKIIGKFERGENTEHEKVMQIINRSMECTRSDPHADKGEYDTLRETGQLIFNTLKFPQPHAGLMLTLFKDHGSALVGSQRDHFHELAVHVIKLMDKISGNLEFIEPTTVVPLSTGEKKKKEKESGLKKRIKFR